MWVLHTCNVILNWVHLELHGNIAKSYLQGAYAMRYIPIAYSNLMLVESQKIDLEMNHVYYVSVHTVGDWYKQESATISRWAGVVYS